jgi:flagellar basal-body rod modification protein FlgD
MSISQVTGSPSSGALGLLNLEAATKNARLKAAAAAGTSTTTGTGATSGTTSGASTSSASSTSSIDSTFLSLLTDELQNQDPTAPMDSTQMVGQMISLNQLDQLISINAAVGGTATTITGVTSPTATGGTTPTPDAKTAAAHAAPAQPSSAETVAAKAALLNSLIPGGADTVINPLTAGSKNSNAAQPLDLSNFNLKSGVR